MVSRRVAVVLGWVREAAVVAAVVLISRGAVAAQFVVVSGSMEPTLMIGDRMGALSYPYGVSTAALPFGEHFRVGGRLFGRLPGRGDVVVFRGPAEPDSTWVKRVVGLPGDRVAVRAGRVWLNGVVVPWEDRGVGREDLGDGHWVVAERFVERLPGGVSHVVLKRPGGSWLDEMGEITVPAGRLFVMGDNRDNSADSRVPVAAGGVGLLPVWNLQGRVAIVLASTDTPARAVGLAGWLGSVRTGRFFSLVH